ncbi:hypothetical protein CsSME_00023294 [Camellia sinensis var. sinensis]
MYIQSATARLEEWRLQRVDTEQWMHHRQLPQDLRQIEEWEDSKFLKQNEMAEGPQSGNQIEEWKGLKVVELTLKMFTVVHSLASSLVVRSCSPSFLPCHSSFTVVRHSLFTVTASLFWRKPSFTLVNLRMPSFTLLHSGTE